MIPVFELVNTVRDLDRADTVISWIKNMRSSKGVFLKSREFGRHNGSGEQKGSRDKSGEI
jgi:hypothetical protein